MPKKQTPAEYVAEHFAEAPREWIAGEIGRLTEALAATGRDAIAWRSQSGDNAAWCAGLIAAYAEVLANRPPAVNCIQVGHNYGPHPLTDVCMNAHPAA